MREAARAARGDVRVGDAADARDLVHALADAGHVEVVREESDGRMVRLAHERGAFAEVVPEVRLAVVERLEDDREPARRGDLAREAQHLDEAAAGGGVGDVVRAPARAAVSEDRPLAAELGDAVEGAAEVVAQAVVGPRRVVDLHGPGEEAAEAADREPDVGDAPAERGVVALGERLELVDERLEVVEARVAGGLEVVEVFAESEFHGWCGFRMEG